MFLKVYDGQPDIFKLCHDVGYVYCVYHYTCTQYVLLTGQLNQKGLI